MNIEDYRPTNLLVGFFNVQLISFSVWKLAHELCSFQRSGKSLHKIIYCSFCHHEASLTDKKAFTSNCINVAHTLSLQWVEVSCWRWIIFSAGNGVFSSSTSDSRAVLKKLFLVPLPEYVSPWTKIMVFLGLFVAQKLILRSPWVTFCLSRKTYWTVVDQEHSWFFLPS